MSANQIDKRLDDLEGINRALRAAVQKAIRRHMLLGESIAVADESGTGVRILSPDEIRESLKAV